MVPFAVTTAALLGIEFMVTFTMSGFGHGALARQNYYEMTYAPSAASGG